MVTETEKKRILRRISRIYKSLYDALYYDIENMSTLVNSACILLERIGENKEAERRKQIPLNHEEMYRNSQLSKSRFHMDCSDDGYNWELEYDRIRKRICDKN